MSLKVKMEDQTYKFEGPFEDSDLVKNQSGVYLVTTKKQKGSHRIIDVGESTTLKDRLASHDRKDQWVANEKHGLYFSVYYCNETTRMSFGETLREHFKPSCGDR
jgi:hypothetical protein